MINYKNFKTEWNEVKNNISTKLKELHDKYNVETILEYYEEDSTCKAAIDKYCDAINKEIGGGQTEDKQKRLLLMKMKQAQALAIMKMRTAQSK